MSELALKSLLERFAKGRENTKKILTEKLKKEFPTGEWDKEPDFLEFIDEDTNIPCLIIRNDFGSLNGYIEVPKKLISKYGDYLRSYLESEIVIHGEITYYGDRLNDSNLWIGFDCSHAGDYLPFDLGNTEQPKDYKNIEYVKNECKKAAMQLHNMSKEEETK